MWVVEGNQQSILTERNGDYSSVWFTTVILQRGPEKKMYWFIFWSKITVWSTFRHTPSKHDIFSLREYVLELVVLPSTRLASIRSRFVVGIYAAPFGLGLSCLKNVTLVRGHYSKRQHRLTACEKKKNCEEQCVNTRQNWIGWAFNNANELTAAYCRTFSLLAVTYK